jgi:DNA-nicking Smr family endonuclease
VSRIRNLRKRGQTAATASTGKGRDPEAEAEARVARRLDRLKKAAELSQDDAEHWVEAMGAVKPLKKTEPKRPTKTKVVIPTEPLAAQRAPSPPKPTAKPETLEILARTGIGSGAPAQSAASRTVEGAAALPRDRRRKLAKGETPIDARLDLHGLTKDAAYHALVGFLRTAQAHGARAVLVITGKGLDDVAIKGRPFNADLEMAPRGVLRRAVPTWLKSPPCSDMVQSFGEAHPRHGGQGALYITLRKR